MHVYLQYVQSKCSKLLPVLGCLLYFTWAANVREAMWIGLQTTAWYSRGDHAFLL